MSTNAMGAMLVRQFGHPTGPVGLLAGLVMAVRPSNRERITRTLELLQIHAGDLVLEIGFGPGLAIARAAASADEVRVVGIDRSRLMLRMATLRNARAIREGRVQLQLACAESLPAFADPFDKAFAINVHMFWAEPAFVLQRIASALRPGGVLALTFQPRRPGATGPDALRAGERAEDDMRAAGFSEVRLELLEMKPVAAVCVLGRRPTTTPTKLRG